MQPPDAEGVAPPVPPPLAGAAPRILANTTFRTLADLGSKVASLALYVAMARRLGDSGFGVFSFSLALVTIVTTFAGFGYKTVLVREVARDHSRLDQYFAATIALQVGLSVPALVVVLATAPVLGFSEETTLCVAFLGVAVIAESLMGTVFAVWQAWERLVFVPVVLITQRWLTAAVGIGALLAGVGVVTVAAVYLLGALGALGLSLRLLYSRVVRPQRRLDMTRLRPLFAAALPIGIAGVFATVIFRADTVLLGAFATDGVVGQYGAAFRLLESTLFVSWGVGMAVYPVFARRSRSSSPTLGAAAEGALKLVLALILPLTIIAAMLSGPVIRLLYGDGFEDGALALALLAPAITAYPLSYVAENLLLSQDRQAALLRVYGVGAVLTVGASFALIPALSLAGAAIVTSTAEVLIAGALIVLARQSTGPLDWRRVGSGPVIAAGVCALAIAVARREPLLAVALGGALYVAALVCWERRSYPHDLQRLLDSAVRRPRRTP